MPQTLNTYSSTTGLYIGDSSTTGSIRVADQQTSGDLNIGYNSNNAHSTDVYIGNSSATPGGDIIVGGNHASSRIVMRGSAGIDVETGTLLKTQAGITNTGAVITSTPGITFGGSTLLYYEAGDLSTHLTKLQCNEDSVWGSQTHSGTYTRIGNVVHIRYLGTVSSWTAGSTSMDTLSFINLPFYVSGAGQALKVQAKAAFGYAAGTAEECYVELTDATKTGIVYRYRIEENNPKVKITAGNMNGATYNLYCRIEGFYFTS